MKRAGVVAVQGDVAEHIRALLQAYGEDLKASRVRSPEEVESCDLLVLPGGESTAISRMLKSNELIDPIRKHVEAGRPLLATCAGLIIAASEVPDDRVVTLGLLDATIERNGFGRQRDSFEAPLDVNGLEEPFPGVFIRAPRITSPGSTEILARYDGEPVAIRQGSVVGASFHPELTNDPRFHRLAISALR